MGRLAPEGNYTLNDKNLKYMSEHGKFTNRGGELVQLTQEEQHAARDLLSAGGITNIDDDKDGWIGEGDFRRVAENGASNQTNAVQDFAKWMNI